MTTTVEEQKSSDDDDLRDTVGPGRAREFLTCEMFQAKNFHYAPSSAIYLYNPVAHVVQGHRPNLVILLKQVESYQRDVMNKALMLMGNLGGGRGGKADDDDIEGEGGGGAVGGNPPNRGFMVDAHGTTLPKLRLEKYSNESPQVCKYLRYPNTFQRLTVPVDDLMQTQLDLLEITPARMKILPELITEEPIGDRYAFPGKYGIELSILRVPRKDITAEEVEERKKYMHDRDIPHLMDRLVGLVLHDKPFYPKLYLANILHREIAEKKFNKELDEAKGADMNVRSTTKDREEGKGKQGKFPSKLVEFREEEAKKIQDHNEHKEKLRKILLEEKEREEEKVKSPPRNSRYSIRGVLQNTVRGMRSAKMNSSLRLAGGGSGPGLLVPGASQFDTQK